MSTPKAQHTPGPCGWCSKPVDPFQYHHVVGRNDNVPIHSGACMDAWIADAPRRARLEDAAPELYEALQLAHTALTHHDHGMVISGVPELLARFEAVLAKVTP